jgi:hypothetical protein
MPATSEKQRKFMGAELARKRAGKATETKMTESQLEDFAKSTLKPKKGKSSSPPKRRSSDREPWER